MNLGTIDTAQILDMIKDAIYVLDTSGSVLYVNNATVQLFGYDKAKILRFNVFTLTKNGTTNLCLLARTLANQKQTTIIQNFVTRSYPGGKKMLVTQIPIFNEHGRIEYCVGIIQDIADIENAFRICAEDDTGACVKMQDRKGPAELVAMDPATLALVENIGQVADSDTSILITGESGVGKEVFADYIHRHSSRSAKPMIKLNCASLPESLLEAELFGYEKGSFTGASAGGREGLIEAANHGTLFMDEINSLPLSIQGKLLRVLDTKMIRRIGSNRERHIDFRLMTATNEDLQQLISEKKFRADLYYRCNIIPIDIPPLRKRKGDIRPLCTFFLNHYNKKYAVQKWISEPIFQLIEDYDWPGNVRELKNFIERTVLLTDSKVTCIQKLPDNILSIIDEHKNPFALFSDTKPSNNYNGCYDSGKTLKEQSLLFEQWIIEKSIEKNGSLTKAARELQADKSTLIRKRKNKLSGGTSRG